MRHFLKYAFFTAIAGTTLYCNTSSITKPISTKFQHGVVNPICEFSKRLTTRLESSEWLNKQNPDITKYFNFAKYSWDENYKTTSFVPYVEKLIVEPETKIVVIPDIHGNARFYYRVMKDLVERKIIRRTDNGYQIAQENLYFIFLGDYVNALFGGAEILLNAIQLSNNSPGKVFLLRGNHENIGYWNPMFASYCHGELVRWEVMERFSAPSYADANKFFYTYDLLSLTMYLGCKNTNGSTDFLQISHSNFEVGYNAKDFLDSTSQFHFLERFDRPGMLAQLPLSEELQRKKDGIEPWGFVEKLKGIHLLCEDLQPEDFVGTNYQFGGFVGCGDFLDSDPGWDEGLGDGISISKKTAKHPHRAVPVWGEKATKRFLDLNSSSKNILRGIIRGHQHGNHEKIYRTHGFMPQWNGTVTTLASASTFPRDNGDYTYFIITTKNSYREWTIEHNWVTVRQAPVNVFSRATHKLWET
ncbi:hypothetical protein HOD08_02890 [bacterium]|nr:hypothetical protein [bacterium]